MQQLPFRLASPLELQSETLCPHSSQFLTNETKREEASTMEDFLSCLYSLYMIPYVFPRNITHYIKR
jgi:hypothetical protein